MNPDLKRAFVSVFQGQPQNPRHPSRGTTPTVPTQLQHAVDAMSSSCRFFLLPFFSHADTQDKGIKKGELLVREKKFKPSDTNTFSGYGWGVAATLTASKIDGNLGLSTYVACIYTSREYRLFYSFASLEKTFLIHSNNKILLMDSILFFIGERQRPSFPKRGSDWCFRHPALPL
ncbi:hypothetical protein OUZ56_014233 [Daphnia magna]|uniref:Uncharacterized protein n=1 Tax=Daphnia magna TaxID=35525 RepID=A0ABQ9Z891_9CRUS|nr:hypothetical protein OUZ56_014233 [Daphnia magna]